MFRFTIRELLIFTLTAGLAVGWWADHRKLASKAATATDALAKSETNYVDAVESLAELHDAVTREGYSTLRFTGGKLSLIDLRHSPSPSSP